MMKIYRYNFAHSGHCRTLLRLVCSAIYRF